MADFLLFLAEIIKIRMKVAYYFLIFILLNACAASKHADILTQQKEKSNCNQDNSFAYSQADIPKSLHELQLDTALTANFSTKDLNVANAIGALDLLKQYVYKTNEVSTNNSLQNQIDLIKIQQNINNKIDLASLEISSVAAELDCEEERINQIASFLKEKEKKVESVLTVSSIILGSLTAIVTGIIVSGKDESNATDYLGVGVGIADAALGITILTHKNKIELQHSRNILREIWNATPTSSVYPPSIWYYMNYYNPNKTGDKSLREQLIDNWKKFDQVSSSKPKSKSKSNSIDIYFGDGGKYTSDELENRANMYDQIESTIKLMKQDLRSLTLSINNLR